MSTASARPDNLAAYRSRMGQVDSTLGGSVGGLLPALETYRARCPGAGADPGASAAALGAHAKRMEALDGWVGRVGEAFRAADRAAGPVPAGVVLSTDEAVTRAATAGLEAAVAGLSGKSAQQVHDWWASLTESEQQALIAAHPGAIGGQDGIPAWARDQANRLVLADKTKALTARLAELDAQRPPMQVIGVTPVINPAYIAWQAERSKVQGQLDALNAVSRTVAQPDRQLLLLDLDHDLPRAAVAVGNVDTANHVAVFTPGLTTTVAGSLGRYDRDMARLVDVTHDSLDKAGRGGETVAAVTWIGYDVPQWSTTFSHDSVLLAGSAQEGGKDLARFLDGITASRDTDPHLTALGHSYGSTTTGYALRDAHTVDDAVLFGSPGLGTSDLHDLNVPAGHVGIIEADRDPVADLGRFGHDPNQLDGVTNLSSDKETSPEGRTLERSTGHSAYLSPDSSSQYNIAQTVGGMPERRIEGDNYGFGDALRDPSSALSPSHAWKLGKDAAHGIGSAGKSFWHHVTHPW